MLFPVRNGIARFTQRAGLEAAARNTDLIGQRGDRPKKRSAAARAKAAHLIVVAFRKMKRVLTHFARFAYDVFAREIRRNAKRAPGTPTSIRAMTHAVVARLAAHRDRCVAAGAGGGVFVVVARFHASHYTFGAIGANASLLVNFPHPGRKK
jgi:hypothetical protein